MNCFSDLAQADLGTLYHGRDVVYGKRRTVLCDDGGLLDIFDTAEQAHRANIDLLQAGFDETASRVGVVARQLLFYLGDAQAVGDELVRVHLHLILAGDAAEAGDVHDVGHGLKLLFERPVFDGFQLHQVVAGIGASERVPKNLPNGAPVRAQLRLHILRQGGLRQPLERLVAGPVVRGLIVENKHHAGKPEQRDGAEMLEMRNSVHLNFNGDGDLLFDFFGGATGPLGDDLDVVVRHVRIGFDGEVVERNGAPNQQQSGEPQNDELIVESVDYESANHWPSLGSG